MGRKHDRTAVVIQPKATEQKPTPVATMNFNSVMDQRGCVYVWKPKAMPPYSKHSIHYPPTSNVGDEDIPIHNTSGRALNGATPNLLLAAAFTELKQNAKTDPTVIYHLEKALGRLMQLNLLERVS